MLLENRSAVSSDEAWTQRLTRAPKGIAGGGQLGTGMSALSCPWINPQRSFLMPTPPRRFLKKPLDRSTPSWRTICAGANLERDAEDIGIANR